MRITVNNVVLCGGQADGEFPDAFTLDGQLSVQIAQYLRASNAKPIGRGNRLRRISFKVTRAHSSHRAACEWAVEHEAEIPQSGTVTLYFQDSGQSKYFLQNGEVESTRCEPIIGSTTIHAYNLVGSAISKKETP